MSGWSIAVEAGVGADMAAGGAFCASAVLSASLWAARAVRRPLQATRRLSTDTRILIRAMIGVIEAEAIETCADRVNGAVGVV